jgi:antitoxin FitA
VINHARNGRAQLTQCVTIDVFGVSSEGFSEGRLVASASDQRAGRSTEAVSRGWCTDLVSAVEVVNHAYRPTHVNHRQSAALRALAVVHSAFAVSQRDIMLALIATEGFEMAQLIVRKLDDDLVTRLKRRAAANGRSAEEEHRQLLRAALLHVGFVEALLAMPSIDDDETSDADFDRSRDMPRDLDL